MDTKDIVQSYYKSLDRKDNSWKNIYSEDAVFSDASQTLFAKGKEEVIHSFQTFLKGVAGVQLEELILEGNKACAIVAYEYANPKGERMSQYVAEVWEVKNDKLAKLTIYFDLTAYRNFMRG